MGPTAENVQQDNEKNPPRRFIFRGNAMPFGGRISSIDDKTFLQPIPGPPVAALTVSGGFSLASSRGSSYLNAFQWGETLARSVGESKPNGHQVTTVESSLANFRASNEPHHFTANLLHIEVVSDHPAVGEPSIVPVKVYFGGEKGLLLDGDPIKLTLNKVLEDCPTFSSYHKKFPESVAPYLRQLRAMSDRAAGAADDKRNDDDGPRGYILTSMVSGIVWRGQKIKGNMLKLDGFGRLYFGEVLINHYNRRFTMVRLAMGSYMGAEVSCAEADPNGTW